MAHRSTIFRSFIPQLLLSFAALAFTPWGWAAPAIAPTFVGSAVGLVNTSTPGQQTALAAGALADGGYVVAWLSQPGAEFGPQTRLLMQRYDDKGGKRGRETPIPVSSESPPAVGILADGSVVVASSSATSVSMQRFNSSGAPVGPLTEVFFTGKSGAPGVLRRLDDLCVLTWEDGSWLVGWATRSGADANRLLPVFQTRRYAADGTPAGAPITVPDVTPAGVDASTTYRLTAAQDGGYLVSTSFQSRGRLLRFTRFDSSQRAVGTFPPPAGEVGYPEDAVLLALDDGRHVLWSFLANGAFVYSQTLDGKGNASSPQVPASTLAFGARAFLPFAARVLGDGSYAAVWVTTNAPRELLVQQFDKAGAALGSALAIPFGGALPPHLLGLRPLMASLEGGGFALAWTATTAQGDVNVYTRSFHAARPAPAGRKQDSQKKPRARLAS